MSMTRNEDGKTTGSESDEQTVGIPAFSAWSLLRERIGAEPIIRNPTDGTILVLIPATWSGVRVVKAERTDRMIREQQQKKNR